VRGFREIDDLPQSSLVCQAKELLGQKSRD
jgi:hypothetical protein